MPDPINYMAMMPRVDLGQSVVEGLQIGGAIRDMRKAGDAEKLQQQYAADLQAAMSNPTARGFAALTAKYPQQREAFKQSWEMLDKDQQEAEFGTGTQVYSALQNQRPDVAAQLLDQQIAAMENSGQDASDLKSIKAAVDANPRAASAHIGLILSATDPDRWGKMMQETRDAEIAPANLSEAQAKAHAAGVKARFAESKAAQDLAKGGWDIAKLQSDIGLGRQNASIALMNAQLGKETNELKKQELQQKVMDAEMKRDAALREKTSEVASTRAGIDNSLNTIDRLLANPELNNILGSVEGSDYYPSTAVGLLAPGADADVRADAIADLENVQSQSFLNNLMEAKAKGATFGALTEKEGDRLIGYVKNLKAKQSEKQFRENALEVQRLLLKSRSNLSDKFGVPDIMPDRPEAQRATEAAPAAPQGFRVLGVEGQ